MQRLAVKRGMARIVVTVLAASIVQYTLAFASWSMVPGNAAPGTGNGTSRILWLTMSFPIFWLLPRDFPIFQMPLVCNSVVWGLALGFLPVLLQRVRQKHVS